VGVKQQKSQTELAFMSAGEVKPKAVLGEGTETPTAGSKAESQAENHSALQSNRPVRTRMPGGVGGGRREASPYPDLGQRPRNLRLNELSSRNAAQ
jgi:hypothetical protein